MVEIGFILSLLLKSLIQALLFDTSSSLPLKYSCSYYSISYKFKYKGAFITCMKTLFIAWARHSRRAETLASELGGTMHFVYTPPPQRRWLAPLRYLKLARQTWSILEQERPQSVLVQAPPIFAPLIAALWCKLRSTRQYPIRLAIDCHSGSFYDARWRWSLPVQRLLSRFATVTVVACTDALRYMKNWHARGLFLVDGLPTLSLPSGTAGTEGTERIAVISSFEPDEPIAELFAAARLLPQVSFYFSGDARRLSASLRPPANVVLTGFLSDEEYSGLLHNVHGLLVLTSEPNVLNCGVYEALVAERPAVISNWPLLRSCFDRGCVYVSNDARSIADGVEQLLAQRTALTQETRAMRSELNARRTPIFQELVALLQG